MLVLDLLGTLSLRNETHPVPVAAQQKRPLGLLAILGLSARQGLSRDRIEAYLWPESSSARAQHALDQTVYAIRHALGSDVIVATGRELRLNPDLVRVDAWEFEQAIRAGQWTAAVGHYKGPLLDGFYFADSHELESWIDTNRTRLRLEYQKAIEFLANLAAEARDHSQAVIWLRRLANSDPLSAGATKKLMLALAAAGDRAGAVQYARVYQELVRQELEMEPDSEIEDLAAALSRPATTATVDLTVSPHTPSVMPSVAASAQKGNERSRWSVGRHSKVYGRGGRGTAQRRSEIFDLGIRLHLELLSHEFLINPGVLYRAGAVAGGGEREHELLGRAS